MNIQCQEFRDYFLQNDLNIGFNAAKQGHYEKCADCREFMQSAILAVEFLQEDALIPDTIHAKLEKRLFTHTKIIFNPALVFSVLFLFIISSVFFITDFNKMGSGFQSDLLVVESVLVNGKTSDFFLDQNENYVNIYIPLKGEKSDHKK